MKIQTCIICNKPFFPEIRTSIDYAFDFDPSACSECNKEARINSQPVMDKRIKINYD